MEAPLVTKSTAKVDSILKKLHTYIMLQKPTTGPKMAWDSLGNLEFH